MVDSDVSIKGTETMQTQEPGVFRRLLSKYKYYAEETLVVKLNSEEFDNSSLVTQ